MTFGAEYRRICGIIRLTYSEKSYECNKIFQFFQRLCVMGDIGTDIFNVEGEKIPYYVCQLTLRSFLEMQACIFEGAYHSAARSLRWLFEINMIGATACIKPILLEHHFNAKKGISLSEFEKFLDRIDKNEVSIGKGKRKTIFDQFKLPTEKLQSLYSDLCKYTHLSKISFDKELTWPNLQYIHEKFDEIFVLATKTLDLVFWMQSRMCLCFDGGTIKALKYFLKDNDGLNQYLLMTVNLLSSLK
jgi:hypothetical protein